MKKVVITHKFRLYPNKQREANLLETLELCKQTYNSLLNELNRQKVIDRSQIQGVIPDMRMHKCPFCGFEAPRDYNSALDVKRLTLKKIFEIGQELPKSTLVKMEALPTQLATSVNETRSHNLQLTS